MKYILLMHPSSNSECYVYGESAGNPFKFETIDAAVKHGMAYGTDDFWVITVHEWSAVELQQPTQGESEEW